MPNLVFARDLNSILRGQAVGECPFPITAPDDSLDPFSFREFQLYPPAALFTGDPGLNVSNLPVIDMFKLVYLQTRQSAGSSRFRAGGCECYVPLACIDFQLINARLA